MPEEIEDAELRDKAEKIVEAKAGFRANVFSYLIINLMIFVIWLIVALTTNPHVWFPWFLFPLVGWGIGIAFHAWAVYGGARFEGRREDMVQKEMDRMKKDQGD
ncbi:MAG TPA: 2TM domain-containing protein [Candidatus Anoxymicrobiaceae bacterium]